MNQIKKSVFELLTPEQTRVDFANTVEENDTFNMVNFFYVYNGGGVATGDLNNDSLPDLFFTGNMVHDCLYLNNGELHFTDISQSSGIQSAGWSTGVTLVDINTDGLLDIYVCRSGNYSAEKRKNQLLINNGVNPETGEPTFTESAEAYGIADTSYSTQSVFFDYDRDGDLDMYLLNHTNDIRNPNQVRPLISDGTGLANDRLYRNNGNQVFTDVTVEAGILYDGLGLGVSVSDVNEDGWLDIFVTNDFIASDYLYINNQDGTFIEAAKEHFGHISHFSMGHDVADFNNDGLPDIFFAGNMVSSRLYINQGDLRFDDMSRNAGIETDCWATGVSIADVNQDGWMDIYLSVGGFVEADERKNLLFIKNQDLTFTESAEQYGLADDGYSTQAAFFDYDRDGDLDVYVM